MLTQLWTSLRLDDTGVLVLNPGQKPPADPGTYTTLYFAPGIHDLGKNIKLHSNKNYYIPGDAIVYGTFNNFDLPSGENIKLYGLWHYFRRSSDASPV